MKRFIPLFIVLAATFQGYTQEFTGARSYALSGCALTLDDVWSVRNNQAAMAWMPSFTAGVFYRDRFALGELSDQGAAAVLPIGNGAAGIDVYSFGNSHYRDSRFGLAYALRLSEKFSAGIQLNYRRTQIAEGYGSHTSMVAEGGILYKMNQYLTLAVHLANPTQARLVEYNNERYPTMLSAGASYRFTERVVLVTQVEKESDAPAAISAGLEYWAGDRVALRAGVRSNPSVMSFGVGWKWKTLLVDFASGYHPVLGFTPSLALTFQSPLPKKV